jgi:predicted transcriptional regulator YdeE
MDVKIVELPRLILAGFSFYGDPFETSNVWTSANQIGRLWERLMAQMAGEKDTLPAVVDPGVGYGIHIYNQETEETGQFEVFVGLEVDDIRDLPVDVLVKVLPPSTYAVFSIRGAKIIGDWYEGIDRWLTENLYKEAHSYNFQYYDQRFLGLDRIEESEIDVYVPITAK